MKRKLYTTQIEVPKGRIDFGVGHPGWSVLPLDIIRQASEHRLSQGDALMLNYGPEQGDGSFLEALAAFLTPHYGFDVDPLSLMVTGGASQALDMVCTFFMQPGDTIFVEEPTYFVAPLIFRDHQLNIVTVPMDEDGMNMDALEALLAEHQPKFVYTIPAYQNPTGITLTAERRQRLVTLSVAHDFLIVADEVYQMLNYTDTPPPPFAAMIDAGTVISVGSFSKILGPGMRLGWIQAGEQLLDRMVDIKFIFSGGAVSQFTAHIVRSALELGLQEQYLQELKQVYTERSHTLATAVQQRLGDIATFRPPAGGFFMWVELPTDIDTSTLKTLAADHDVGFQAGVNFSSDGALRNCMRLCFTRYPNDELTEGVSRLAQVLTLR
ncbi:MAG: PLP-dependent aminotransferase family protein [Chloroflexota bacterium]